MANVTETPSYDAGIYQIETTDPVLGGPNGIANAQAKGLANRTAFLKQQIDQLNSGQLTPAWIASQDYVQEQLQKLDAKQSVRAATIANITLSGVQTIDGVALTVGDRVLVKDQTAAAQNGIYLVAAQGWTRAADADNGTKLSSGARVAVEEGSINAGKVWYLANTGTISVGSTALLFRDEHAVATQAVAGIVRIATTEEALAGQAMDAVMTSKLVADSVKQIIKSFFVGVPIPWPSATPPDWAVNMTGQAINQTTDPILATRYPALVVPDMRAMTVRGWDNGRGIDTGRAMLSYQEDAMQGHAHGTTPGTYSSADGTNQGFIRSGQSQQFTAYPTSVTGVITDSSFGAARVSSETRIKGLAYNYVTMRG